MLGIYPDEIIINGSFVTGRESPGDVDSVAIVSPQVVKQALDTADDYDRWAIASFARAASNTDIQSVVRIMFGTHIIVVPDESSLRLWCEFYQSGNRQGLPPPDPARDPSWVKAPNEKGILRVELRGETK